MSPQRLVTFELASTYGDFNLWRLQLKTSRSTPFWSQGQLVERPVDPVSSAQGEVVGALQIRCW